MRNVFFIALCAGLLCSCKEKSPKPTPPSELTYSRGVLISNEGPFSAGSGTLSWYDNQNNTIENDVFQRVNNFPLGSVFHAIMVDPSLNQAYFILNNSQKIVVSKLGSLQYEGEITGFSSPRYMLKTDLTTAYVTDWVSNSVAIVDLNSNAIQANIPVGVGPERLLAVGNRVVVVNSGGFGVDSTISVINSATHVVENTYVVGHNPNSLVLDANGMLWILCGGINDFSNPANSTAGKLIQFDLTTGNVVKQFQFPTTTEHPVQLCRNKMGNKLYWLNNAYAGSVVEMDVQDTELPLSPMINGTFYALNVDLATDEIYTTDALDYQQNGILRRFTITGNLIDSVQVGLIPGGITFN